MRKRHLLLVILLLACLFWLALPKYRINKANFDRIQNGMTREEVNHILGGPPYTGCALELAIRYPNYPPPAVWEQWAVREDYGIRVCFDGNGKVLDKIQFGRSGERSLLEKICDWLRLP